MNRKEYLEMCQKCAVLPNEIFRIKQNVPDELKVVYEGMAYYPLAYTIDFDLNGKPVHIAILHDLKTHSQTEALLERVELYQREDIKNESRTY